MDTQLLIEERHVLLKSELDEKLHKKYALELEINKQFEELKKLEISLEKALASQQLMNSDDLLLFCLRPQYKAGE
jgi:hypothetical protein